MPRRVVFLILGSLTLVGGSARAQAPSAPLQLNPGAVLLPNISGAAHAAVPSNWKIVDSGRDPLNEMPRRTAITLPKSNSAKNGKSGATGLVLVCLSADPNAPTHPEVALVFTSLTGTGNRKKFPSAYRFDEEPLRSIVLTSDVGVGGSRRLILPTFPDQNPVAEIAAAKEFRIEVDLHSAGTVFLDFNVSGAAAAISAIACR